MRSIHYTLIILAISLLSLTTIQQKKTQAQNTDVEMFVSVDHNQNTSKTLIPSSDVTSTNLQPQNNEVMSNFKTTLLPPKTAPNNVPINNERSNNPGYPNQSAMKPTPNSTNDISEE